MGDALLDFIKANDIDLKPEALGHGRAAQEFLHSLSGKSQ